LLLEGIARFNAGEFYDCHEVLEELWRAEPAPVRALYQGILQIGVALHHLRRGNWRGAVKLLRAGTEKVARFQPRCQGVDTASLLRAACACLAELERLGPDGAAYFDWRLAPRITVEQPA
jgi:predicted metal-dependent hydrolase